VTRRSPGCTVAPSALCHVEMTALVMLSPALGTLISEGMEEVVKIPGTAGTRTPGTQAPLRMKSTTEWTGHSVTGSLRPDSGHGVTGPLSPAPLPGLQSGRLSLRSSPVAGRRTGISISTL
jgi:hypothetical protein